MICFVITEEYFISIDTFSCNFIFLIHDKFT